MFMVFAYVLTGRGFRVSGIIIRLEDEGTKRTTISSFEHNEESIRTPYSPGNRRGAVEGHKAK